MDYLWLATTTLAIISIALAALCGYYRAGAQIATCALLIIAATFGWYVHGGLTSIQARNYYQSGEYNGYNRGYRDSQLQQFGKTDNSTRIYNQFSKFGKFD